MPDDDALIGQNEVDVRNEARRDVCAKCEGDGYTESWNDDQSDVVITICTDCGPGPGDFDA